MNRDFSVKNNAKTYYFHEGTETRAYEYFGAHKLSGSEGKYTYSFRVYAHSANSVELTGDFNSWDALPMVKISDTGIFELVYESDIPLEGMRYKYRVQKDEGSSLAPDPFACYSEHGNHSASIVYESEGFEWHDKKWLSHRAEIFSKQGSFYAAPLNIYEVDLASWKTRGGRCNSHGDSYLNYRELARELKSYVSGMGYTHIELLKISDGFAPTSRFGTPDDFRYFVDTMHKSGIGVILAWKPAELFGGDNGFFEAASPEARSYTLSNALFWLREFHIDGLRAADIGRIISTDAEFLKKLNGEVLAEFFDVLMISDGSVVGSKVTNPADRGGLGFNFKWNTGFSRDMFSYVSQDPYFRAPKHSALTFSLMYAFSENHILTVSHEDVSNGKHSLIDKMYGGYDDKFAGVRAFLGYMMTHPGKKLMFMGTEFGQLREWDPENQLEWFLADLEAHKNLLNYVRALNSCYFSLPPLWEKDLSPDGFEWIYADRAEENLIAFKRIGEGQKELICIINFAPVEYPKYAVRVGRENTFFCERINSDSAVFGGRGRENRGLIVRRGDNIFLDIPPLSALIIEPIGDDKINSAEVTLDVIKI